jgi:hypothetical protein
MDWTNYLFLSNYKILIRMNTTSSLYRRLAFYAYFQFEPRKDYMVS